MRYLVVVQILALVALGQCFKITPKADCAISINANLGEPQPLILRPGAPAGSEWAYPNQGTDIISVTQGAKITLACPGSTLQAGTTDLGINSIDATCVGGLTFTVGSAGDISFTSVTCKSYPEHTASYTGNTCTNGKREIAVGFTVNSNFLNVMTICFDSVAQHSLWSTYTLSKSIGGYQVGFPRPSFIQGSFYNVGTPNVDTLYSQATQRITVNRLLGLPDSSTKYIASGNYYLSRGHLTAKADYVFGTQHRATFWFVNVAPQWQTFNGGNWNTLESNVQDYGAGRPNDLIVYTGTHGVATLPHESTGQPTPLYLYTTGSTPGIPVPELYWKVLYDPVSKQAVGFVGANNPYVNTITPLCTNICGQLSWLTWRPTDVVAGLGYCCDVRELRQAITIIPNLDISGVLT